jgi:hypothetical protein
MNLLFNWILGIVFLVIVILSVFFFQNYKFVSKKCVCKEQPQIVKEALEYLRKNK